MTVNKLHKDVRKFNDIHNIQETEGIFQYNKMVSHSRKFNFHTATNDYITMQHFKPIMLHELGKPGTIIYSHEYQAAITF